MHALPGDDDRLRELLERRGAAYPGVGDWRRVAFAIRNTSFEQRATAQSRGLDIVFHRAGHPPLRLDHEELALVRATLDALEDVERVHCDTADLTELQLWAMFRRYVLATQWTSETDRAGAERDGRDLVVHDDEGHAIATVSAEELAVMRESEARLLGEPPTVAQSR